jgi:hypothetical protein
MRGLGARCCSSGFLVVSMFFSCEISCANDLDRTCFRNNCHSSEVYLQNFRTITRFPRPSLE